MSQLGFQSQTSHDLGFPRLTINTNCKRETMYKLYKNCIFFLLSSRDTVKNEILEKGLHKGPEI